MTSTPAPVTGAPQDSNFTRNATGLVREVSKWDALIMNTLGMNVAVGSVLLLQQPPGAAALQVLGTTFDQDDRATEVSLVLYRADRFKFSLESHRIGGKLKHVIGHPSDGRPSPPAPAAAGRSRRK